MAGFYVVLPSDSSGNYFPHNTLSSYTTQLAQPLELKREDNWHCALVELSYPYGFDTLEYSVLDDDNEMTANVIQTRVGRIVFPVKDYSSLQDIYTTIKDSVTDARMKEVLISELQWYLLRDQNSLGELRQFGKWTPDEAPASTKLKNSVQILIKDDRGNVHSDYTIEFPCKLWYGLDELLSEIKYKLRSIDDLAATNLTMRLNVGSDIKALHLSANRRLPDVLEDLQPVFVYSDIISPQFVGDTYVKNLRVIQFPNPQGHHIFNPAYYFPIEKTSISSISIALRSEVGKPVRFETSPVPTIAILHFERKT